MTQTEFMTQLANRLIDIPLEERRAALDFYNNYFQDARDEGRSDAEVIASLESPAQIAARIRAEFAFAQARRDPANPKNTGRVLAAVFGILSLPITVPAAIVVLALGIALTAVLLAFVLTAVGIVLACVGTAFLVGLNAVVLLVTGAGTGAMFPVLLGMALMALGLTVLFATVFWLLLKLLARVIAWAGRGIYRLFAGNRKREAK